MRLTLAEIVELLGGECADEKSVVISRVGSLAYGLQESIGFLSDTKYISALSATKVSAVIVKNEHAKLTTLPKIITDNPYAYFAKLSALLNPKPTHQQGVHASAVIASSANIAQTACIAAAVVIGENVFIGEQVKISAGCVIEEGVSIGKHTILEPHVVIKHGTQVGDACHLYAGCVIGNDGFGYAETDGTWVKIPQVGRVLIGNHVDIGANSTVDRGTIDDTVIEDGVKLDNLIQVAHNCRIGAHTVIAGCVGIAGSAVIGKDCKIGGAAMILGHLSIADNVTISPGSMIMSSITQPGTYTALMPSQSHKDWLKTAVNIRHLNQLTDKIKHLEEVVQQLSTKP